MKINILQYAQTLLDLTDGKSEQEVLDVINKFAEQLKSDGQLKNADKIMEKFSEIYNKKNGIVKAEVVTRYKLHDAKLKEIESYIKTKYAAKSVELVEVVNEDIKGGIVIRVGDEVMDASVGGKLEKLRKELVR
ncbi:MAG: ATP synthase F1 subunit delta [Candidatus Moraniibacteriota bacterium]